MTRLRCWSGLRVSKMREDLALDGDVEAKLQITCRSIVAERTIDPELGSVAMLELCTLKLMYQVSILAGFVYGEKL